MKKRYFDEEVRYVCCAYYQVDLERLKGFPFVVWSTARDKKDLLDIAIRNWEVYWCDHFGVFGNEWLIMDVWREYSGNYRDLVAQRISRRCPPQFRALAEDRTLKV